jgi:long-chain acyl-CoA synthetase
MTEVRPTIIITVPRLLDKMYFKLLKNAGEMSNGFRKKILKYAVNLAKENIPKKSLKWKIADFLVYKKIRKRTGGRIKYFVSGGGALNKSIGEFFDNIGIVTLEGYGMTETSPVISVNLPSKNKYGTVGPPLDTVKVKLADDGEIMVKGELVMKGYYNNPEETSRTIVDGWLYTGDIGEIDTDGYIKITERKKSLFKTSGGKYIAPTHIEELLSQIPYIDQVIVVGNEKMYVTALFVPDLSELKELAKNLKIIYSNIKELIESELLIKKIQQDLSSVQKSLANYERIRKFTIIEVPFSIETGELTPSLKLKRKYIEDKYKMVIENMYHKI